MAVLTPALVELRATFNRRCPNRDKSSDGWIGDAAHARTASSHNPDESGTPEEYDADRIDEVHAIDVDEDLRSTDARGPFTMMRAVRQLVDDHRTGRETRLTYIIYERTIWAASWGWGARQYTGANPHDKHAHLNGSYEAAKERDTRPWNIGFVEENVALTRADAELIAKTMLATTLSSGLGPKDRPIRDWLVDGYATRVLLIPQMRAELAALRAVVEQLAATIRAGGGSVDTVAILSAVDQRLATLRQELPEAIADAVVDEIAS